MWADLDLAQARWRVVCQWLDAGSGIDRGAAWAAVADGNSGACGRGAGKWRYAPDLDVFIGLSNVIAREVWVYKLHSWHHPLSNSKR